IHPEEMGITAMHEHILWGPPGWEWNPQWWYSVPRIYEKIYNELLDFKGLGGATFVDVSGIGLGRDLDFYVNLARSTGVHIVACTGFWEGYGILGYFHDKDIDYFTELFVHELTKGMGKTNIKAGIIKVGTGPTMTPLEELTFRAAARAAKETGCAVTTHGVLTAMQQMEVLTEEGLDPSQIIIGHLSSAYSLDLERDKEIARRGAYLGYDHIGIEPTWSDAAYAMPDERKVELIIAMVEAGYAQNLILSCDVNGWSLGWKNPYHTVAHLLRYFVPRLHRAGISEEMIHTLLVENPKRVLPF
ncbi:MAG: phosphotriesterase, partial [Dehalococcoidia bacterium]